MIEIREIPPSHPASVQIASEVPFKADRVAATLGGIHAALWQGRQPEFRNRSYVWNLLSTVFLVAVGLQGWGHSRSLLPLPNNRCRITDSVHVTPLPWLLRLSPIYRAVLRVGVHVRHAGMRWRLLAQLSV
jgi:hypothetical protein